MMLNNKNLSVFILVVIAFSLSACSNNKQSDNLAVNQDIPQVQVETSVGNVSVETIPASSYSLEDVKAHASKDDCWTVIDGKVYNLTSYIASGKHKPVIEKGCGIDSSEMFKNVEKHSEVKAQDMLPGMMIGSLAQ